MINVKKINYTNVLLVLIIIFLVFKECNVSKDSDKRVDNLKRTILQNDSLIKEADGEYKKLIDDTKTEKELKKKVKKELKKKVKKPLFFNKIKMKLKSKKDTSKINNDAKGGFKTFKLSYPTVKNPILEYEGMLKQDSILGTWKSKPYSVYLYAEQRQDGLFELKTKIPEIIEVTGIEVSTLPIKYEKEKNFRFVGGIGVGYNYETRATNFEATTGLKYKDIIITASANTDKEVKAGVLKIF